MILTEGMGPSPCCLTPMHAWSQKLEVIASARSILGAGIVGEFGAVLWFTGSLT